MLKNFDHIYTPGQSVTRLMAGGGEDEGTLRYFSWKQAWESHLINLGWRRPSEITKKGRKKLLTVNNVRDDGVDLVMPIKSRYLTFLAEECCECCTIGTLELVVRGRDAKAIIFGDDHSGRFRMCENTHLQADLPAETLMFCYGSRAVIDFCGKPYQMNRESNFKDALFEPVTDEVTQRMFEKKATT